MKLFKNDVLVKSIINVYLIKIDLNRKIKKWSFITLPFIKNDFVSNLIDKNSVSETKINIQFELNQLSVSPLWGNRYFSIIRRIMLKIFLVYLQMTEKYLIPQYLYRAYCFYCVSGVVWLFIIPIRWELHLCILSDANCFGW